MAATLYILLMLVVVTAVHELGHLAAALSRRTQVTRVVVGRGTRLARLRFGGIDFEVGLVPVGGRVEFVMPRSGVSTAVIALGGAAANVAFGFLLFWCAALAFDVPAVRLGGVVDSPFTYAVSATATWLWAFPAGAVAAVFHGDLSGLALASGALRRLLAVSGLPAALHSLAALSAIWAALNMLPIPGLGTDGWKFLVALRSSIWQSRVEEDRA